jgi:dTDP-4-amino-4,6-dideoxygalactose transaminase
MRNEERVARRYLTEIKNEKIVLPYWDKSSNHVFHLFVIRQKTTRFTRVLAQNHIQTLIHYHSSAQAKALGL